MFNERRDAIQRILNKKNFISYQELSSMFPDVSVMTLRRDIEFFEKNGSCTKVRGGAKSLLYSRELSDGTIAARMQENVASKEAIARVAASYLEIGRATFLDSGSTLQRIVPFVPNERFSFVTTSPQLAMDIAGIGLPSINLIGGLMDAENQTVSGMQAMRFLQSVNIDIALLSPSGVSARSGFTVGNFGECELKRAVVEKARLVILLLDASKIDKSLPYTFCNMSEIGIIITDGPLPKELLDEAAAAGTEVINVFSAN